MLYILYIHFIANAPDHPADTSDTFGIGYEEDGFLLRPGRRAEEEQKQQIHKYVPVSIQGRVQIGNGRRGRR